MKKRNGSESSPWVLLLFCLSMCAVLAAVIFAVGRMKTANKADAGSGTEDWTEAETVGKDVTGDETQTSDTCAGEDEFLLLVNRYNPLPEGFSVSLADIGRGHKVDGRIYGDTEAMLRDMREAGLSPVVCSSYRTEEKQKSLFEAEVGGYLADGYSRAEAEGAAAGWVAAPGTSEHQTGLALDIVDESYQLLDRGQEATPVQRWLSENAYRYGFILRYPNGKSEITGVNYEPWHYRYVGKAAAREIYDSGVCLEEYLGCVK